MKSKTRVKIAAGIIIIVTAVTILSLVVINLAQKPSREVLTSNAKLNNAGYLAGSKLFLVLPMQLMGCMVGKHAS